MSVAWVVPGAVAGRVVTKPARAGSSVGVRVALGAAEAHAQVADLLHQRLDHRVVVER